MAVPLDGAEALARRLRTLTSLRDDRAVVVIVEAPRDRWAAVTETARSLPPPDGPERRGWTVHRVDHDDNRALATLNRERDLQLRSRMGVLLLADTPDAVRRLRAIAPDLTAAPDLWVQIAPAPTSATWHDLSQRIRALMIERHGHLDFTGLLPRSVEYQRAPLADLYVNLLAPARPTDAQPTGHLLLADPGAGKTTLL
ncbi:MAG: hypothetical protein KC583_07785, partial [Myxococcales bacterium]|nr:hypothetical protein [Myxococcales bacterium]